MKILNWFKRKLVSLQLSDYKTTTYHNEVLVSFNQTMDYTTAILLLRNIQKKMGRKRISCTPEQTELGCKVSFITDPKILLILEEAIEQTAIDVTQNKEKTNAVSRRKR